MYGLRMSRRFAEIGFVGHRRAFLPLLSLGLGSCGGDDPAIRRFRDTGTLCLLPGENGVTTIAIAFDTCLSCGDIGTASCRATVTGDRVAVSTALDVVRERQHPFQECNGECSLALATCDLNVPSSGDYRIVLYGSRSATVTLPVTSPVAPYGDGECAP
jgi:hypothetical protein